MEKRKYVLTGSTIVIALILAAVLAYLYYPGTTDDRIDEAFPGADSETQTTVIANGTFRDGQHDCSGTALMIVMDNEMILRFEDFKTDDGPGLYVYLSVDLTDEDHVSIGKLEGIEGNMNYDVPAGTNVTQYNNVLIWCEPFGVLFGYAELE